jgi:hypothetical protein
MLFLVTKDYTSEVILREPFALRSSIATIYTLLGRVTILITTKDSFSTYKIRLINRFKKELDKDDS